MDNYSQEFKKAGLSRNYDKGQLILHQGDQPQFINFLVEGFIKIYDIDEDGNQKLLMILNQGDMFPFFWSFNDISTALYFYEALTDIELVQLTSGQLNEIRQNNEDFSLDVTEYLTHNLHDLMYRLQAISSRSAEEKIQNLLPYVAHRGGREIEDGVFHLNLKLTQQDIADMAGITRETTSKVMSELDDKGLVERTNGHLLINVGRMPSQPNQDWEASQNGRE